MPHQKLPSLFGSRGSLSFDEPDQPDEPAFGGGALRLGTGSSSLDDSLPESFLSASGPRRLDLEAAEALTSGFEDAGALMLFTGLTGTCSSISPVLAFSALLVCFCETRWAATRDTDRLWLHIEQYLFPAISGSSGRVGFAAATDIVLARGQVTVLFLATGRLQFLLHRRRTRQKGRSARLD